MKGISLTEENTTDAERTSDGYQKTGDLITLPYTEKTLIDQPFASKFVNVNPFNVFTWVGSVELDPPGDEWKETERVPELVINQNGMFDTMAANAGNPNLTRIELGTIWNEWQDNWVGRAVEAERRAYADRAEFLGDTDFTDVPISTLISKSYAQLRFSDFSAATNLMDEDQDTIAGNPELIQEESWRYNVNLDYRLPNDGGVVNVRLFYFEVENHIGRIDISPSPTTHTSTSFFFKTTLYKAIKASIIEKLPPKWASPFLINSIKVFFLKLNAFFSSIPIGIATKPMLFFWFLYISLALATKPMLFQWFLYNSVPNPSLRHIPIQFGAKPEPQAYSNTLIHQTRSTRILQ